MLDDLGLRGFPKTSGQTGLHVMIPTGDGIPFPTAKVLVELLGRLLQAKHDDIATIERVKEHRGERVYIDTGQTGRSRTIVCPYSVRATPGARVSTPLHWDEVHMTLDPSRYDMFTVPARLKQLGDPMRRAVRGTPRHGRRRREAGPLGRVMRTDWYLKRWCLYNRVAAS